MATDGGRRRGGGGGGKRVRATDLADECQRCATGGRTCSSLGQSCSCVCCRGADGWMRQPTDSGGTSQQTAQRQQPRTTATTTPRTLHATLPPVVPPSFIASHLARYVCRVPSAPLLQAATTRHHRELHVRFSDTHQTGIKRTGREADYIQEQPDYLQAHGRVMMSSSRSCAVSLDAWQLSSKFQPSSRLFGHITVSITCVY